MPSDFSTEDFESLEVLRQLQRLHPGVRPADQKDENKLHELFQAKPMKIGKLELVYDRRPSFQNLLEAQGSSHITWLMEGQSRILGCGSVSAVDRWYLGKKHRVSYLSDLRISEARAAITTWRKFYPDALAALEEGGLLGKPTYHLTAVLKENLPALRALTGKNKGVEYHPFREPWMVNIFGRLVLRRPQLQVRAIRASESDRLLHYLKDRACQRAFGYDFPLEQDRRLKTWPGFDPAQFLVCESGDRWLGVCLPWSPSALKRLVFQSAPWLTQKMFYSLKWLGRKPLEVGAPISTTYLSSFYWSDGVEGAAVASAFLDWLQRDGVFARTHFLSFCAPDAGWLSSSHLKGYIKQLTPTQVFLVAARGQYLDMDRSSVLDFEMALV